MKDNFSKPGSPTEKLSVIIGIKWVILIAVILWIPFGPFFSVASFLSRVARSCCRVASYSLSHPESDEPLWGLLSV